jgi:hypothetical protein
MKYIIPQDKIDKAVFKYLDMILKGLEKRKPEYYDGFVLRYPNEEYGILGYRSDGTLYIYYELINKISSFFGLKKPDIGSIIGRWVSNRLQLEVINTTIGFTKSLNFFVIDYN